MNFLAGLKKVGGKEPRRIAVLTVGMSFGSSSARSAILRWKRPKPSAWHLKASF